MSAPVDMRPRGLPEALPAGERILWQGSPAWWPLAVRVFHIRTIALYCVALIAWRAAATWGGGWLASAEASLALVPLAAVALALLGALAVWFARSTIYTITNRRVVMRVGVALPLTFNLPFRSITAADLRGRHDGTGDIALTLTGDRVSYAHLWPHARPWRFKQPQPMLRSVPQADAVAAILGRAVAAAVPVDQPARGASVAMPEATARPSLAHPATA